MWWGVVTLTTVGYGDVYPITPVEKFIGALVILVGIGMFALPAGVLASGFVKEVNSRKDKGGQELKQPILSNLFIV
jgi:voltage-gated potassium channel